MENPRRAPGRLRIPTSPRAPKIFHFLQAPTTPPWWSCDRNPTSAKSPTRRKLTRDSRCQQIWRSRRTLFLVRRSRLPWRDLCQGGSWYLLDISLGAQIIFPFTDFSFCWRRQDMIFSGKFYYFNLTSSEREIKPYKPDQWDGLYSSIRELRWFKVF